MNTTNNIVSLYQNTRNAQSISELNYSRVNAYNNNWITLMDTNGYPEKVIVKTIGRKGKNFINKTEKNNLLSIWYDCNSNVIEFWGDNYNNRLKAIKEIHNNLNQNLENYNKNHIVKIYNSRY